MTYISAELKRAVKERAGNCCEYCRRSQDDLSLPFHIEHILPEKHGGKTEPDNLALSCPDCNAYKGPNIGSYDDGQFAPLFNPRTQAWDAHFRLDGEQIQPLTAEGRVTVRIFRLNQPDYITERRGLILLGRYPCRKSD